MVVTRIVSTFALHFGEKYNNFCLLYTSYFRYSLGADVFTEATYNKVENISLAGLKSNQDKRALHDRWQKPGEMCIRDRNKRIPLCRLQISRKPILIIEKMRETEK